MKNDKIDKLKSVLKELNKQNYDNLKLGLDSRVELVERVLCKIEMAVFGQADIQNECYVNINRSERGYYRQDENNKS